MKRALFLLLALMLIGSTVVAKDLTERPVPFKEAIRAFEVEPNDDCGTATTLTIGDPMEASINPATDHDWYVLTLGAARCVQLETFPGMGQVGGDTRMWLYADDCVTQLAFNDDGGEGLYSLIEYEFTSGGTYYIEIDEYGNNNVIDAYVLTAEICPPPPEEDGSKCRFLSVCYDWDFAVSDHGFTPVICDAGLPVWEYGATAFVPGAPGNVWGTILAGNYPNNSGEGLVSPPFMVVAGECDWMEIMHFVQTERFSPTSTIFDGCNVTVDGVVIQPLEGYSGTASTSPKCVRGEEVWAGQSSNGPIRTWGKACFDLSAYAGMTIQVSFDFGSDGSVQYPGWYLAYVKVGTTDLAVDTETDTWGGVKSLYR